MGPAGYASLFRRQPDTTVQPPVPRADLPISSASFLRLSRNLWCIRGRCQGGGVDLGGEQLGRARAKMLPRVLSELLAAKGERLQGALMVGEQFGRPPLADEIPAETFPR